MTQILSFVGLVIANCRHEISNAPTTLSRVPEADEFDLSPPLKVSG